MKLTFRIAYGHHNCQVYNCPKGWECTILAAGKKRNVCQEHKDKWNKPGASFGKKAARSKLSNFKAAQVTLMFRLADGTSYYRHVTLPPTCTSVELYRSIKGPTIKNS